MATQPVSFYRPHKRVQFTGELVNHKTGELYVPPSRTKQSFAEECDINNILKQYKTTGMLRHVSSKAATGVYADLPDPMEFQDAMNTVLASQNAFSSLPSKLRNRFHNDPVEFLEFCSNLENADELVKLGLATAPAPQEGPKSGPTEAPAPTPASPTPPVSEGS